MVDTFDFAFFDILFQGIYWQQTVRISKDKMCIRDRPKEAIKNGASYLVVGRPITKAEDPVKAANLIVDEMAVALAE